MSALIEAYVTNLGKYAEYGVEAGETLKFPATTEEVQALLKRIGVDGVRYEEIFITAFDGDVLGICDCLGEYFSSINFLPFFPICSSCVSVHCRNSLRALVVASVPISVHHPQ